MISLSGPAMNLQMIIIIILDGTEIIAISSDTMKDWGTDSDAWGLDCQFVESGWSSITNGRRVVGHTWQFILF